MYKPRNRHRSCEYNLYLKGYGFGFPAENVGYFDGFSANSRLHEIWKKQENISAKN